MISDDRIITMRDIRKSLCKQGLFYFLNYYGYTLQDFKEGKITVKILRETNNAMSDRFISTLED